MSDSTTFSPQQRLIGTLVLVTLLLQGILYYVARGTHLVEVVAPSMPVVTEVVSSEVSESQPAVAGSIVVPESTPALPTYQEVVHVVASGQTLSRVWTTYGAPTRGAIAAEKALKDISAAAATLRVGDRLTLRIDERKEITFLQRKLRDGSTVTIEGDSAQGYRGVAARGIVLESERSISGVIDSSFVQAARAQGVPFDVIDDVVDLFSARLEFRRELQQGDSFTLVFTERRLDDGTVLEAGPIHAASISKGGAPLFAVRYVAADSTEHFFDEHGEVLGNYFLRYPVKFSRISSAFSYARFHPVLQRSRPHNGVDFAAPAGTPVRAVADGIVELAGYKGDAGNMVRIRHCDRYTTAYLHLQSIDPSVRAFGKVQRGQVIGKVGSTGLSTGAHLHFSLYDRGVYVDPMSAPLPVLTNTKVRIPVDYLRIAVQNLRRERETIRLAENLSSILRG